MPIALPLSDPADVADVIMLQTSDNVLPLQEGSTSKKTQSRAEENRANRGRVVTLLSALEIIHECAPGKSTPGLQPGRPAVPHHPKQRRRAPHH